MLKQIKQHAEKLCQIWLDSNEAASSESNPQLLQTAWLELCQVIERIDANPQQLSQNELHEIANHGVQLHLKAINWIERLQAQALVADILKSLIVFAAWAGRLKCELEEMEFIINTLGEYSNHASEQAELEELAQCSADIIHAVPQNMKTEDPDNPRRPWRVLLLNNAIIATRSNRDKLIEQAYSLIGEHLPDDAPGFFAEAMKQMEKINYPDNVKILARRYYELWYEQTLH